MSLSEAWDLYDRILSDPRVTLVQEQEPKDVEWSTVGRRRAEKTD